MEKERDRQAESQPETVVRDRQGDMEVGLVGVGGKD